MKLMIGATLLALLAGVPAYAQQDQEKDKDKPKPQQEEPKKQPEKEKPPQERPPQEKDRQQQDREKEQAKEKEKQDKDAQKQEKQQVEHQRQQQPAEKAQSAQRQDAAPSRQAQRDGGNANGRRIREEDFRSHFGREHRFRVARRDDRRFQYGGYWFEFSDPWPVGWSYDDDVYVDEIDGQYYLIDPVHPGIRLLIIVAG
jgi:flagellar motor protein MotB